MQRTKKQQVKALKKRAERDQARRRERALTTMGLLPQLRQARHYPLEGCWVREDWQEHGLTVVLVARRQPDGRITFAAFMVDYYCLGVKDAFYEANISPLEFKNHTLPSVFRDSRPLPVEPALAHELIYGSIEYAARFGFSSHPDFQVAQYMLDPPGTYPVSGTIQFGKEGKPFYISGPYDDVPAILSQLRRVAGEGNYHYLVPLKVAGREGVESLPGRVIEFVEGEE